MIKKNRQKTKQKGVTLGLVLFFVGVFMLFSAGVGTAAIYKSAKGIGGGYMPTAAGGGVACPNGLSAQIPLSGAPGLMEGPPINMADKVEEKKIYLTAYYTPLPNQSHYVKGNYEAEQILEGNDTTASGQKTAILGIAAPPSYPFGTRIEIPGYGLATVVDRGCDIKKAGVKSDCPTLADTRAPHDHIDVMVGRGDVGREAMKGWHGKVVDAKIYWYDNMSTSERKGYLGVCKPTFNSMSKVPLYKQNDPQWANHPYDYGTILKNAGCGPTAAAMILTYHGHPVTPPEIADESVRAGYRAYSEGEPKGTDPRLFTHLAKKYGLTSKQHFGWDEARQYLQQGKPLIAHMGHGKFSSGSGHYIVLTGISNGTVYINDPGPRDIEEATEAEVKNNLKGEKFTLITP